MLLWLWLHRRKPHGRRIEGIPLLHLHPEQFLLLLVHHFTAATLAIGRSSASSDATHDELERLLPVVHAAWQWGSETILLLLLLLLLVEQRCVRRMLPEIQ